MGLIAELRAMCRARTVMLTRALAKDRGNEALVQQLAEAREQERAAVAGDWSSELQALRVRLVSVQAAMVSRADAALITEAQQLESQINELSRWRRAS